MSRRPAAKVKGHKHGQVPRAFREEQLLDVAEKLFATQGYHETSIEGIAEAAGVSRPMVYLYFKSKDGVYLACLRRARRRLDENMARATADIRSLRESLTKVAEVYFEFVETSGAAWDVLFGGGGAVAGPAAAEAQKIRSTNMARIAQLLEQGTNLPVQQVQAFARMQLGAGEQLAKWWRENPDVPRKQVIDSMGALIWFGLKQYARD